MKHRLPNGRGVERKEKSGGSAEKRPYSCVSRSQENASGRTGCVILCGLLCGAGEWLRRRVQMWQ